jgi:predicted ATP-grasp superfamily ATP-dependent carboligase/protein-tyrosine-phosphatase
MKAATLILGAGVRLAVTVARSLHKRDIPVLVSPLGQAEKPIRSRSILKFVELRDEPRDPEAWLRAVEELVRTENIDLVMPTGDGAMSLIGRHYSELTRAVQVACPSPVIMNRVLDKSETLSAAVRVGVPIPRSQSVIGREGLEHIKKTLSFPIVVKPVVRTGTNPYKVLYFRDLTALSVAIASDSSWCSEALVQEYCDGVGVGVGVLMHGGEPLALFQHRRLKELPFTGGVSVSAIAERLNPELTEAAVTLLREIGWEGVAMVEFRHRSSDGAFWLMEVNGRFWGSLFVAVHAGLDFPYYQWQLKHGERPEIPGSYKIGTRARWLAGDLNRLHRLIEGADGNGIVPRPSVVRETLRFFLEFLTVPKGAVWSLRDPMPGISEVSDAVLTLGMADAKSVVQRLLPRAILHPIRVYRSLGQNLGLVFIRLYLARALRLRPTSFAGGQNTVESVLFLCLGNIYRSAFAEATFRQAMANSPRKADIVSAGLWPGLEKVAGRRPPEQSQRVAAEFGVSLENHVAKPVTHQMVENASVILVMDYHNEATLVNRFPEARKKVYLLGALALKGHNALVEISDPYSGGDDEVRRSFQRIKECVAALARLISQPPKESPE